MVDAVARAFGQGGRDLKETPDAIYLRTPDGLVYAFFEDPDRLAGPVVKRLVASMGKELSRLVVLSLRPVSSDSTEALEEAGASVVAGDRFLRLLDGLELSGFAESGPIPPTPPPLEEDRRVLPTAERLDQLMDRARLWMSWEVPAIALRFFDEATQMKPEYAPGLLGQGMALIELGAGDAAESIFERVLSQNPGNEEARIGLARVTGLRGDPQGEIDELTSILKEDPRRHRTRASLVAALAPMGRWKEVRGHLEEFLKVAPEDPYFHAFSSICLEHLGDKAGAAREKRAADGLGMSPELWEVLEEDLVAEAPVPGTGRSRSARTTKGRPRGPSKKD